MLNNNFVSKNPQKDDTMQPQIIISLIMLIFVIGTFIEMKNKKNSNIMVSSLQKELQSNMEKLSITVSYAGKEINSILKNIHMIQRAMEMENKSTRNMEKQLTSLLQLTDSFLKQVEDLQNKIGEAPKKNSCPTKIIKAKKETQKEDQKEENNDINNEIIVNP